MAIDAEVTDNETYESAIEDAATELENSKSSLVDDEDPHEALNHIRAAQEQIDAARTYLEGLTK